LLCGPWEACRDVAGAVRRPGRLGGVEGDCGASVAVRGLPLVPGVRFSEVLVGWPGAREVQALQGDVEVVAGDAEGDELVVGDEEEVVQVSGETSAFGEAMWPGEHRDRSVRVRTYYVTATEDEVGGTCPECGGDIVARDAVYHWLDGTAVHARCNPDEEVAR
jgi:hypothetical protein